MTHSPNNAKPGNVWPPSELEHLGSCPICHSTERRVLHRNLTDRLFGCAPGEWSLYTCQSCGTAYLDPRPNPQSIGKAYSQYFTHENANPQNSSVNDVTFRPTSLQDRARQWVRAGFNGYRNAYWHMELTPSNTWGRWWVPCIWPLRSLIMGQMRNLPHRPPRLGARLLDVGCGNGAFLEQARAAGWDVQGVDFDPLAVAAACKRGLDVRCGGLEQVAEQKEAYDWVTCSHVIEHVHNPLLWLQEMHALLRPGGTLWLQTPNIESWGHQKFGPNWRGLEPPRHLTLFTLAGLCQRLKDAGFTPPKKSRLSILIASAVMAASEALRDGKDATVTFRLPYLLRLRYLLPAIRQLWPKSRAEFITVLAKRSP